MSQFEIKLDPATVIADLDRIAQRSGGRFAGAKRLAWTPEWIAERDELAATLKSFGLEPEVDVAGNLWATIVGESERFVIVGSHIDAVPNGGWLDGSLGTIAALDVMRQCARLADRPPIGIKFVCWADEEGARFTLSLIGSSACCGTLDADAVRSLTDADGVSLEAGLRAAGVDLDEAARIASPFTNAVAYFELHIEQGPALLEAKQLACAVSGTVGVERHVVTFTGEAAHSGSTPMLMRHDSLLAAAQSALAIRESAIAHNGVATTGKMESAPGVVTAVAGTTTMLLDQRQLDPGGLAAMWSEAQAACEQAAKDFGCTVSFRTVAHVPATPFHPALVTAARNSVREAGGEDFVPLPSGPLHDATEVGRVVPTVMIFAQSDPGISHTNVEDSPQAALEVAVDAYGRTVAKVVGGAVELAG